MTSMEKAYDPSQVESKWYQWWQDKGLFAAHDESDKPSYCIAMPPPNVTGSLHMGHALTATLQDIMTRWRRMSGYNALWIPGTDHAGIATQMVVERELMKENVTRFDLGREKFVEKVWEWKHKYHARITEQHKHISEPKTETALSVHCGNMHYMNYISNNTNNKKYV